MIQHPDINIGPGYFKNIGQDKLLVTRIFYTVQGEGPFNGCPAVFIRLAGCNRGSKATMGCAFCDTKFNVALGQPMTYEQILHMIDDLTHTDRYIIVITGGEPMMQDNLTGFIKVLNDIHSSDIDIQIESNGDRLARGFIDLPRSVKLVVSPKITGAKYHVLAPEVTQRVNCLKYVISADPGSPYYDLPEYILPEHCPMFFQLEEVYLSPITVYKRPVSEEMPSLWNSDLVDQQATRANYKRAKELSLLYGYRLTMQMHLLFEVD